MWNVEVERPNFSVGRESYPWQTQKWRRPSSSPLVYKYVLPEDQQKTTEMVKTIASKYGLEVEVIDVTMENSLSMLIQRKREKIDIFPTLIACCGQKVEGEITEKQVKSLLLQMADKIQKGRFIQSTENGAHCCSQNGQKWLQINFV